MEGLTTLFLLKMKEKEMHQLACCSFGCYNKEMSGLLSRARCTADRKFYCDCHGAKVASRAASLHHGQGASAGT
jgi:hypothetical protein